MACGSSDNARNADGTTSAEGIFKKNDHPENFKFLYARKEAQNVASYKGW